MKKNLKMMFSVVVTLCFSAAMFYCFVGGAPEGKGGLTVYMLSAAGLSVLMPGFCCGCLHYIFYLRKKLDDQRK